jgi:hypothetical protein
MGQFGVEFHTGHASIEEQVSRGLDNCEPGVLTQPGDVPGSSMSPLKSSPRR